MFRVLVDERAWRVLITGREEDLDLLDEGWELAGEFGSWREAYKVAARLADAHDMVLEWYVEEVAP
ncbi:hypothetical protein TUZN_0873 [Thermoproteus uzoniensis 768-20]|uniref:Uncharacterized protein n=1 Tax=Thermoproteus uzoniensis (strain 768-20) TaxID=999630 RepID=F2L5I8_THEU7|nr:hypothetical protein [Thermoproteus uzoniensis]AEA12359.1 hypothetical protein TUZN_0873 [Thermoproteus uzoniensis 768-20]